MTRRNKDYEAPKSTCFACGKVYTGPPPVCPQCAFTCEIESGRGSLRTHYKYKGKLKCFPRNMKRPHSHYLDVDILDSIVGIATNESRKAWREHEYHKAWEKRDGKCSGCKARHPVMRVVRATRSRKIRSMWCPKCYKKMKDGAFKSGQARKQREWGPNMILWAKADNILKFCFKNNPLFMEKLWKEIDKFDTGSYNNSSRDDAVKEFNIEAEG